MNIQILTQEIITILDNNDIDYQLRDGELLILIETDKFLEMMKRINLNNLDALTEVKELLIEYLYNLTF